MGPASRWMVLLISLACACGDEGSAGSPAQQAPDASADAPTQPDGAHDSPEETTPGDSDLEDDGSLEEGSVPQDGAVDAATQPGVVPGMSAWIYDQREAWRDELVAYDVAVQAEVDGNKRRLAYLFPYVGGVVMGSGYGTHEVWYDDALIDFYAEALPQTRMLPILDSADGEAFESWSEADQRQLANELADLVLERPDVAGEQVDIEPFRTAHLPFYDELAQRLHAEDKLLTVFTGASSGDIYSLADIVVLSGYDLGISPLTTGNYTSELSGLIENALSSAASAGTHLMVGVPLTASWEEYEYQSGTCDSATGATQEQWFAAALAAVCVARSDPRYVGMSLWGFYGDALELPRGSGCFRHPGTASGESWAALVAFGSGC